MGDVSELADPVPDPAEPSEPDAEEGAGSEPVGKTPAPRPPTGPALMVKPPRSAMTVRDMGVALAVLVAIVLAVGGVSRACTFSPAGPTVDPTGLPVVDAPAELRRLAPDVPFGVRIPALPPGWRSNSVAQDRVPDGAGRAVRTGFLTPAGRYLRLLQSDAPEAALLAVETGARPVAARGTEDVGGQRWVVYGERPAEPIWIAEVTAAGAAPVRLLITGSGTVEDFRVLAGGVVAGELLRP